MIESIPEHPQILVNAGEAYLPYMAANAFDSALAINLHDAGLDPNLHLTTLRLARPVLKSGGRITFAGLPNNYVLIHIAALSDADLAAAGYRRVTPRGGTFNTPRATITDTEPASATIIALGGSSTGGGGRPFNMSIAQQVVLVKT